MELRHLRYFVAVAEELSFTAAAFRLGVSQPPLSQQIQDLERELRTALFTRTSRRVMLTPAGMAFLEHARAILSQAEQAAEQARAIGLGRIGTLDIGTTGSVLIGPLALLITAFGTHFPDIIVRIHEMPPQEQQASLHTRRIDISFLRRPAEDADLVDELAWNEKVGVALPKSHPLSMRHRISLSSLREESFVFLRLKDSRFAQYLRDYCIDAGFVPRISQQVVESYSLTSLVAAGLGVALVPESLRSVSRAGLVHRPLIEPAPVADVRMLYHPDHSVVVGHFLSFAREFLKRFCGLHERPELLIQTRFASGERKLLSEATE
jgi:DNA-binding transcriptional LysR family regulator